MFVAVVGDENDNKEEEEEMDEEGDTGKVYDSSAFDASTFTRTSALASVNAASPAGPQPLWLHRRTPDAPRRPLQSHTPSPPRHVPTE